MNTVLFSVIATGETVQRTFDSNGMYRDKVLSTVDCPALQAKRIADWKEQKLAAMLDYRASRATPIKRDKRTLAAIDYLLGDKYRDKRTLNEKRQDKEWAELLANGTHAERLAYLDNAKSKLVRQILGDNETVHAMREWLASPHCSIDAKCERASYADMQRELMA